MAMVTKWVVPTPRGPQKAAHHAAFGALKSKTSDKQKGKTPSKSKDTKELKQKDDRERKEEVKCLYCGMTNHSILKCFRLSEAQAAEKSVSIA